MGAVLSQQDQEGWERVLDYANRALNKPERNYFVPCLLGGAQFTIRSDHSALRWLLDAKEPEGQMARWIQELCTYEFRVIHRPGKKHSNVDGLSRVPMWPGGDRGREGRGCGGNNSVGSNRLAGAVPEAARRQACGEVPASVGRSSGASRAFPGLPERIRRTEESADALAPVPAVAGGPRAFDSRF